MENQKEYISFIKTHLKNDGFSIKNNVCYKIKNEMLFIVFFKKRMDGIYNTELGISLDKNTKPSIKNVDFVDSPAIGININKEEILNNYNETILKFILNWFNDRDSLTKIKNLLSNNNLGYYISPKLKDKIK